MHVPAGLGQWVGRARHAVCAVCLAALGCISPVPLTAQEQPEGAVPDTTAPDNADRILDQVQAQIPPGTVPPLSGQGPVGILVLDQSRFLAQSRYGQRVQREFEAASAALAAENREIEAQLTEEELQLTDQRQTMDPAAFRLLAIDFDERVEAIRAAQEAKGRSLQTQAEAARSRFFELSFPILLEIVQDNGASVLMDSRTVLLAADTVDITDQAIAAIDATLGEGGADPLVGLEAGPGPALPP